MIELVVVIVILGILYFAGVKPFLNNTQEAIALNSATETLKSDLKFARLQAMQTGRFQQIQLGTATYNIQSSQGSTWISPSNWQFSPFPLSTIQLGTTLPNNTLIYDRLGTPYEDAASDTPQQVNDPLSQSRTITVQLNQLSKTITINQNTGIIE